MSIFVVDAMSSNPVMVGLDYPARLALADAERCGVKTVLVLGKRSTFVGTASRAALRAAGRGAVREAIRIGLATISDQATLDEAEVRMETSRQECLPVVAWDGTLRGVITRGDIRRAHAAYDLSAPDPDAPRCASCGAAQGVQGRSDEVVFFCGECLAQTRPPQSSWEELYFTIGGTG